MQLKDSKQEHISENTYINPVISGDWPDPAVFREDGAYYLVASTARYYPSLTIWRSYDLVSWEPFCNPVRHFEKDVWAPDFFKYNGKYYIYFTAGPTNYVTYSDHIEHGWCDPIDLQIGHIDPGHCVEAGKRYIMLSGGYIAPLSDDGLEVTGPVRQVVHPAPIPDEWDIEGPYFESPKITWRNGYYYLTYADGGTGGPATSHMVMSARSRSLFGPWEYSPYNPIVHTWSREETWHSKGHGHLVDDTEGNWWIIYHAFRKGDMNLGRSLLLEQIVWLEDNWFCLRGGTPCDAPLTKPSGKPSRVNWELSDRFDSSRLKITWKMFGKDELSRAQPGNRKLVLKAMGTTPGNSSPIVVSAGESTYVVSVCLEKPAGCEAGLIQIFDEQFFVSAGWDGEKLTIYRLGRKLAVIPASGERMLLKLRNYRHYVAFYYALDDKPLQKINYVINTEHMNAAAYGHFWSLRPGLFACGRGTAVFKDFQYNTKDDLLSTEKA